MQPTPARLSDLLRAGAAVGSPVERLLDSWAAVEDAVLADTTHAREDFTAAADALPPVAGAIADRRALAVAVMGVRGQVYYGDAGYLALFPDSGDLRPLLRRALRDGPIVGLVEGCGGAAFMAWVGDATAAARWPLAPEAAAALCEGVERLVVVVSAPSRSSELARRAARALDLTALEARLAEALLFAPNLDVAAADAGVGRETARDALRRINAKAGVRRTPELIARLIALMCESGDRPAGDEALAERAFGLTPAEARASTLIAHGATAPEAAQALGLSPETVKTHMKSALQKTGAKGAKDLARLLVEARELVAVTSAAEPLMGEEDGGGRLRIVAGLDGARRVALIDYGPYGGEPVIVFHGAAAGRRLPDDFRSRLVAAGLRPIVIQRPGFGLTDPAAEDYVQTGADDIAAAIERLRLRQVRMLARDTGIPIALQFAASYPELLSRAVLLNPHPPSHVADERPTLGAGVQRRLLRNPDLVVSFAEFLRRQATTPLLEQILHKVFSDLPLDAETLCSPDVRAFLIRDIQALCARSAWGFAAEHATYANGWRPPARIGGSHWTVAVSSGLADGTDLTWLDIPGLRSVQLEGAGILPQFTHPQSLVDLIVDP